jgi:ABC-type sugar transport system permease subunit
MGSGSALAIVVFVLIGILTYLQRLVTRERADVDG